MDAWRAHLGPLTWPEVLRQVAIIAGAGPKRAKPQRAGAKPKLGVEGEDVLLGESGEVSLKIPARLGGGTMKAAAWLVRRVEGWELLVRGAGRGDRSSGRMYVMYRVLLYLGDVFVDKMGPSILHHPYHPFSVPPDPVPSLPPSPPAGAV